MSVNIICFIYMFKFYVTFQDIASYNSVPV